MPDTIVPIRKEIARLDENGKPIYTRMAGSKELATLEVNGKLFNNWTSVRVEQRWTDVFPTFVFECTENVQVPLTVSGAQFAPGDVVRVFLGGAPAVFGYITERQVGYDQGQHGVRLIGCGDTIDLVNSSVPLDKLNGHDGKSLEQLAKSLSEHLNIDVQKRGDLDGTPFQNIQILPGETPAQAIERYAKMRATLIGSEANGGLLLVGPHPATTLGWLTEGINILKANCVVRDQMVYHKTLVVGQDVSGEQKSGDPQNKQAEQLDGNSTRKRELVVVADIADSQHGIKKRAEMEKIFSEGSVLEAQITVQGWFKDANKSDDLWRAGEYYNVTSPSLILYDQVLGCAGCTYEQTESGTTTTLQMVRPIHMNGRFNLMDGRVEFIKKQREDAATPPPGTGYKLLTEEETT